MIEKGKVIQAKDVYTLYEYFYTFRKLWGDQASRQRLTKEEIAGCFPLEAQQDKS